MGYRILTFDWPIGCYLNSVIPSGKAGYHGGTGWGTGYFGDARRAAVGTELIERVTATGSLVIRKLGATRAGELAIHRPQREYARRIFENFRRCVDDICPFLGAAEDR